MADGGEPTGDAERLMPCGDVAFQARARLSRVRMPRLAFSEARAGGERASADAMGLSSARPGDRGRG